MLSFLNLTAHEHIVTVGFSLPSQHMKRKDLLKIEGKELNREELGMIATFAPNATINIIRKYRVAKKRKVTFPKIITRVMICPNPKCITNHEHAETKFLVSHVHETVRLKCSYCERTFRSGEVRDYHTI